ncbi:hypothetical protein KOR42_08220 [Thalassoglobus neptunius]|uniref:DUF1571 domain-containing protein n=1 Tax=Thalassoglobus neptunius TaxID=1938619 RepID=A0A5C5X554_9PLAN|nr:DUF1571 domain-containing protein [Thalassoglobus neptunius]TWT57461.1 hypothetical protein KOR42_08220 [Thalassoglobus neptunius]
MQSAPSQQTFRSKNLLAISVACLAVAAAHIQSDPVAIGGSPNEGKRTSGPPVLNLPPSPSLPERIEEESDTESAETNQQEVRKEDPNVLRGIWALKVTSAILKKGIESFESVPDYTASFYKQERMNGVLGDGQTIELKMKHEPFSVYMKWESGDSRGQQLIYVDGQNDDKLLVQPGGIKGRLTGVMKLDPTGTMAMSQSRHPVTKAGLIGLAHSILEYQSKDVERASGFVCELRDDQEFEGRPCYLYICEYDSPEINPLYRKSVIYVDQELSMPVCVKNFTWGKDVNPETIDEETLLEFYAYTDLQIQQKLGVADFDAKNRSYRMRVR